MLPPPLNEILTGRERMDDRGTFSDGKTVVVERQLWMGQIAPDTHYVKSAVPAVSKGNDGMLT